MVAGGQESGEVLVAMVVMVGQKDGGCWQCCHGIGVLAVLHEIRVLAMVVVEVVVVELAQGGGAGTRWWWEWRSCW